MKTITCFGDSNTWGYVPITKKRLPYEQRWTGIMAKALGTAYRVEEEGLNGRTTCFDDPIYPNRNGIAQIDAVMITNHPVDLVILMLGTNDTKIHLSQTAYSITMGIERIINAIKNPDYGATREPNILLVAPVPIGDHVSRCHTADDFSERSVAISKELPVRYRALAEQYGIGFLDAGVFAEACAEDAVHLSYESHRRLGAAMAQKVRELLK